MSLNRTLPARFVRRAFALRKALVRQAAGLPIRARPQELAERAANVLWIMDHPWLMNWQMIDEATRLLADTGGDPEAYAEFRAMVALSMAKAEDAFALGCEAFSDMVDLGAMPERTAAELVERIRVFLLAYAYGLPTESFDELCVDCDGAVLFARMRLAK